MVPNLEPFLEAKCLAEPVGRFDNIDVWNFWNNYSGRHGTICTHKHFSLTITSLNPEPKFIRINVLPQSLCLDHHCSDLGMNVQITLMGSRAITAPYVSLP